MEKEEPPQADSTPEEPAVTAETQINPPRTPYRKRTDNPDEYFKEREQEKDILSGRVPFYDYGRT